MSLDRIADGELAAVVTYLEMREPPASELLTSPLRIIRVAEPDIGEYRTMFRRVGAPWLWFSRLIMDDAALGRIIGDPKVEVFWVQGSGPEAVGMLELDFRVQGECELAFVGLVPQLAGQGHGRWLLHQAIDRAWREGIGRVHVHTCSLDHPAALRAYARAGFIPYGRAVERFPDPRLLGILPMNCAPQVPVVGTVARASAVPAN